MERTDKVEGKTTSQKKSFPFSKPSPFSSNDGWLMAQPTHLHRLSKNTDAIPNQSITQRQYACIACANATTSQQPKPDAEPETAVSAKNFQR
jgi:hypothetical protein